MTVRPPGGGASALATPPQADTPPHLSLLHQQLLQVLDLGLAPQQVGLELLPGL